MPDLRNFDLNLLDAFKLLVEEQSVSRAAEKMFISQPAMSHILHGVGGDDGVAFDKSGAGSAYQG